MKFHEIVNEISINIYLILMKKKKKGRQFNETQPKFKLAYQQLKLQVIGTVEIFLLTFKWYMTFTLAHKLLYMRVHCICWLGCNLVRNNHSGWWYNEREVLDLGKGFNDNNLFALVSLLFPDSNLNLVPVSVLIIYRIRRLFIMAQKTLCKAWK